MLCYYTFDKIYLTQYQECSGDVRRLVHSAGSLHLLVKPAQNVLLPLVGTDPIVHIESFTKLSSVSLKREPDHLLLDCERVVHFVYMFFAQVTVVSVLCYHGRDGDVL